MKITHLVLQKPSGILKFINALFEISTELHFCVTLPEGEGYCIKKKDVFIFNNYAS